jgi:hypothetical protein
MQIEMHERERSTLEEFAEKYNLVMEIHERTPRDMGKLWHEGLRYYAHFKNCEMKNDSILIGEFGNGATACEAITDYAQRISESVLVINAMGNTRQEIRVPILN